MSLTEFLLINNWWLVVVALLWTLPWKGVALWKAARNSHKIWFVVLLVVNTFAILEVLYIFIFSHRASKESQQP